MQEEAGDSKRLGIFGADSIGGKVDDLLTDAQDDG